jgi:Uma2 family endonuclease
MTATAMTGTISVQIPPTHARQATWDEYLRATDESAEQERVFFHAGELWVRDMSWEGIDHAQVKDLFIMLLTVWFFAHPERVGRSFSGCLMEKVGLAAAAPDLMLYVGEGAPAWQAGEPRRINLEVVRVPDLVGEIADTTLASDLDEMKQLYAALEIGEYWVVDVRGGRVLMFKLGDDGKYRECGESAVLAGVTVDVLAATLGQLGEMGNMGAANWFMGQVGQ